MSMGRTERLVVFGCSYSYGYALEESKSAPSKLSYAQKLATKLNTRLVNESSPGASNHQILHSILNYKFQPDDLVIVQWSFHNRDTIFHPTKKYIQVGPWETFEYYDEWLLVHPPHDTKTKSWLSIQHGHLFLEQKNVKHFNILIDEIRQPPRFIEVPTLKANFHDYQDKFPKALDNNHPGIECHNKVAEEVYEEIILQAS